jgi:predicted ATPase
MKEEANLSPDEIVFLDRAVPDALAYYRFLNLDVNDNIVRAVKTYRYKKVFVLDLLPIVQDYARREDHRAQEKIHDLLIQVYTELGLTIVFVPVLPPAERVDYILKNL